MATKLSGASNNNGGLGEREVSGDAAELEVDTDPVPAPPAVPAAPKDPMIRRKIEDKLERIRLREELGIYDDDQWKDL
ncbi:MAG: hypothetical protein ABW049_12210 [Spongiibacteraceae bacterium]